MSAPVIPVGTVVELEARCSCGEPGSRGWVIVGDEPETLSFPSPCPAGPFHQLRVTARYGVPYANT